MKTYKIKFFVSFSCKDAEVVHTTIEKTYKAKNIELAKEKANKFLNKLYSYEDMNYFCDNYDIQEVD